MRLPFLLLAPFVLALPVSAQCEVTRLDPSEPIAFLGGSGTLSNGYAAVAGSGLKAALFQRGTPDWVEVANLEASGFSLFRNGVVTSWGDTLLIGMQEAGAGMAGQVQIFEASSGWSSPIVLPQSTPQDYDSVGSGVAIHGDVIVTGVTGPYSTSAPAVPDAATFTSASEGSGSRWPPSTPTAGSSR